jgi:ABC-type glutathione transport system ATPase component
VTYLILGLGGVKVDNTLLSVKGLEVGFDTEQGLAKVLDKVNFEIMSGEIVGLVGESGCGKQPWLELFWVYYQKIQLGFLLEK